MLDKTNDKKYNLLSYPIFANELKHIKKNWLIFFMCFFISRHSIAEDIFPFAIVVLCIYCFIKGPSFTILAVTVLATLSVRFDFVYIVMLIAIFLFFFNFRDNKSVFVASSYSALVLFFSKTTISIVEGFSLNSFMLGVFESIFIFSSFILVVEGIRLFKGRKKGVNKAKSENIQVEAATEAASAVTFEENIFKYKRLHKNKRAKLLNIFSDRAKNKIKDLLLWQNISVKFIEALPGDSTDNFLLSLTIRTEKTPEEAIEVIALTVRNVCGAKVKCIDRVIISPNYYVLKFKNIKRVRIKTYTATAIKDGSPVSGDTYAYAKRSDKYFTVLCDGVGSGEEAYHESTDAVDMLSRLLDADFTEDQILKTLNSLLILKFKDERFVTFDLNIIDTSTKEIRLYKAGAAPTYIMSGGAVEKIEGKSLPMGILENCECSEFKRVIRNGDIIVMISDGIIDSINMDNKKSLERYLELIVNKDPQTIANSVLSYALRGRRTIIDDMTVLVTKIGW